MHFNLHLSYDLLLAERFNVAMDFKTEYLILLLCKFFYHFHCASAIVFCIPRIMCEHSGPCSETILCICLCTKTKKSLKAITVYFTLEVLGFYEDLQAPSLLLESHFFIVKLCSFQSNTIINTKGWRSPFVLTYLTSQIDWGNKDQKLTKKLKR